MHSSRAGNEPAARSSGLPVADPRAGHDDPRLVNRRQGTVCDQGRGTPVRRLRRPVLAGRAGRVRARRRSGGPVNAHAKARTPIGTFGETYYEKMLRDVRVRSPVSRPFRATPPDPCQPALTPSRTAIAECGRLQLRCSQRCARRRHFIHPGSPGVEQVGSSPGAGVRSPSRHERLPRLRELAQVIGIWSTWRRDAKNRRSRRVALCLTPEVGLREAARPPGRQWSAQSGDGQTGRCRVPCGPVEPGRRPSKECGRASPAQCRAPYPTRSGP